MTELSYTAWDDNKYQWPPPDGWYQAADGKWWPEGYGPSPAPSDLASSESAEPVGDDGGFDSGSALESDDAQPVSHGHDTYSDDAAAPDGADTESGDGTDAYDDRAADNSLVDDAGFVDDAVEFEHAGADETDAAIEVDAVGDDAAVTDDVDVAGGAADLAENGVEPLVAERGEDEPGLDRRASDFLETDDLLDPAESVDLQNATESQYSTSSAGMAASGFANRGEAGSSSLGLAGWAETGASDVRNLVDTSQEYDYSVPDGEAADLIDQPSETVDSTLSRLDDLKRQVEQQTFSTQEGSSESTTPRSDLGEVGFDPTETLDIDPNDLSLETNPYYGATDADVDHAAVATPGDEPAATDEFDSAGAMSSEPGYELDLGVQDDPDPTAVYGTGGGEAAIDAQPVSEAQRFGYEDETPTQVADQPVGGADAYGAPPSDYSSDQILTPMSSPPPKPGPGRTVLYGLIGLLALAVAGVAGYLLFQLQGDDGDVDAGAGAAAVSGGQDAGPSDTSGQGPGSYSEPHELAGGVRLTVPVSEEQTEVWMLQVREPAATSEAGEDLVEVSSRVRVRNDSSSGDLSASGLRFVLVSADGSTGTAAAPSCSTGDDLDLQTAIEPGKDIEGSVCWTVPAGTADGALLGIESVHAGGRVHVELR